MTAKVVKTQQELDTALSDPAVDLISIQSPRGVRLWLTESGFATVHAYGSATVEAYGFGGVHAFGSATVHAYDSATVEASGFATVHAFGSATVRAHDSATVEAYGFGAVHAWGSATVRASGSATVRAYDSATVDAYDFATVRASGFATVHAYDFATVRATPHVAVHLHSARATVTGGVVTDVAGLDLHDPRVWAEHHGVHVDGTAAVLYKAVSPELTAGERYGERTVYPVGADVTAPDWRDDHECGGGLHISPRPFQAAWSRPAGEVGTRYLRVSAPLAALRPIDAGKAKARTVHVLAEVDIDGKDMPAPTGDVADIKAEDTQR